MRIVLPKSFRNIIVCAVLMTVQFLAPHVVCATEIVIPQTRQITGRVTGVNSKEGIPGVSVYEKGTTTGTLTDAEGKYSLSVSWAAAKVIGVRYGPKNMNYLFMTLMK